MTDEPRGLRPLSADVEKVLRRLGVPAGLDPAALLAEWEEIAGEPFGSMSQPGGFSSGELTLVVSDGAAATLLKYRLGDLIERLESRFGPGTVTSVRIRVGGSKNRP